MSGRGPDPASERILIVLNDLDVGGSERQALLLARSLRERGKGTAIAGLKDHGSLEAECRAAGVPCFLWKLTHPLSACRLPRNLLLTAWRIRKWQPDVILSFTSVPNLYCGLIWRLTGARAGIWNQRDSGLYRPRRVMEKLAARMTTAFVANSGEGRDFLVRELGVPPGKVHSVRNGVIVPGGKAAGHPWRRRLGLADGDFVGCMVGSLKPPKDHRTLLLAWSRIAEHSRGKGRKAVLLLAGRAGDDAERLEGVVNETGLHDCVHLLGHIDDVYGLLAEVDIGLFSSRSEGLPNGVLECMAAGLPVVASDLAGVRECLGPEGGGALFPVGDAEALAEKVIGLAENAGVRKILGRLNRRRIEGQFSVEAMVDTMASIIRKCG